MFNELLKRLQNFANRPPFDPASIGDPLALTIPWTPARGGGSSFRTHKLVTIDTNRIEFSASWGGRLFCLLFLVVGSALAILCAASMIREGSFKDSRALVAIGLGLIFVIIGGGLLYSMTAPVVFDKRIGFFWKGRKSPREVMDKRTIKHLAKLEDIHALQLVSEYCRGNKSSFTSYELNLVLNDGGRINVVDHGDRKKLKEDAETLSAFLGKPVWDATWDGKW